MSALETLFGQEPAAAALVARIRANDRALALELLERFSRPLPNQPVDEWAVEHVIFNEQEIKGPCNFTGRNYLRQIIRDNNDHEVREQTDVMGRGTGKTLTQIVGIMWKIKNLAKRGAMLFPATYGDGGSRNFVTSRLIKDIKASPTLANLIPPGQERFSLNAARITLGGAHYGFVGSNSAGQVVGNRLGDIRMDEKEKYPVKHGEEAGTAELITGSTEGVEDYQIFNTSTPSVEQGLIWRDLNRSHLHVYMVPCPHCSAIAKREPLPVLTREQTLEILTRHGGADKIEEAMQWQEVN